jgi:hypothetical protein
MKNAALHHAARLLAHDVTSLGEATDGDRARVEKCTDAQREHAASVLESFATELRGGAKKAPAKPKAAKKPAGG